MCGIAGIVVAEGRQLPKDHLKGIATMLGHRGPDDWGYLHYAGGAVRLWKETPVAEDLSGVVLWHRRLSILDLSCAGWQPMASTDGRFYITFNGEIYNYLELRSELEAEGCVFRSRTDTEVLLAGFARWGARVVERAVGMFAFCVLDIDRNTLFLARDHFGIKPLYYARPKTGGFAFASEIKAVLEMPGVSRRANPQAVFDYVRYGLQDHTSGTLFSDVSQLPAGHHMVVDIRTAKCETPVRYWAPHSRGDAGLSLDEAAGRLRELFVRNIELHLRSDVPVGSALSGGIDSSAIVMCMRRVAGRKLDLHTFSFIADGSSSEERWVDVVGEAAGCHMHKTRPSPAELVRDIEHLVRIQDEPFGSTNIYAQYRVFQLAHAAGIKVMLDGQGADELLAGYRYYIAVRLASLLKAGRLGEFAELGFKAVRLPGTAWADLFFRVADNLLPGRFREFCRGIVGREGRPRWLNGAWLQQNGVLANPVTNRSGGDALTEKLCDTLTATSLPHLLHWEDRNSMAFSIESRVPFLTSELAEFVLSLPQEFIISNDAVSKTVFRQAMSGIVPDCILARKDKIGFGNAEREWLLTLDRWVDACYGSEAAASIPALAIPELRREWQLLKAGKTRFDWRYWRCVNLIEWTRHYNVVYN